jgi:D-lyxose ketol-isomerase
MKWRNATPGNGLAESAVTLSIDGVKRVVKAGEQLQLAPGESVTLPPRLYHKLGGGRSAFWWVRYPW